MTENWRTKTARFFGSTALGPRGFAALAAAFSLVGLICRDEDLLAAQHGDGRVHRVRGPLAGDRLARRASVRYRQKSAYL